MAGFRCFGYLRSHQFSVEENFETKVAAWPQRPRLRNLFWFFAILFSRTLSRQRLLHPALLARLQVKGVTLDLLDDVFLLHLALETA
jgi:hypothetical protein